MSLPDIINGTFELLGGAFIALNCRRVMLDRDVKGVSIPATMFFFGWGLWNLFYYPHLGQWWSFVGGLSICAGNSVYVALLIYWSLRNYANTPD